MGTIIHHAAIVTGYMNFEEGGPAKRLAELHKAAISIFGAQYVSPITISPVNAFGSFLIASSGSKLGWTPSGQHDERLKLFAAEHGDCDVVFVRYGEIDEPIATYDASR